MNTSGKLTVWLADSPIEDSALQVCSELLESEERLLVVDVAGYFSPSRISRSTAPVATQLHVVRVAAGMDLQRAIWTGLCGALERGRTRRVLIVGLLESLYGQDIITRDAARSLGRLKLMLEQLADSGLDVTVLCKADTAELGARRYLLSSLCAAAGHVFHWPLMPRLYSGGASAAIA